MWERARTQDTLSLPRRRGPARDAGAPDRHLARALRRRGHAGARPAPAADRRDPRPRARSVGHYRRSGYFTPYTAIVNVTGLPAISLPLYQGEDGLPTGVQLIGPPAREDVAARRSRRSSSRRCRGRSGGRRWRSAAQPTPSTAPIRLGITPRRSASAVPWRDVSGTSSSSASSQVANAVGPPSSSTSFERAPGHGAGTLTIGRRR